MIEASNAIILHKYIQKISGLLQIYAKYIEYQVATIR